MIKIVAASKINFNCFTFVTVLKKKFVEMMMYVMKNFNSFIQKIRNPQFSIYFCPANAGALYRRVTT